ncbi:prepilin-type N-terminal cleavage/methylation domain-containing protein [Natronobeatus ordinarius]|uniref:prepilin-type N-terminal cleavage/methylation domain-containing protein n=1 Tax=Natronobeatus ordinarius TaxID=2963433 RepID=UPI0020CF3E97|nr:prepilin-type N-terminal cleavage/methylation domain-containing protein [Natronobeatus ordinarius]
MAEPTSAETHVEIANWLFGRLVAIILVASLVNPVIFSGAFTLPELLVALAVTLVALYFVVVVVMASLSKVLDAKLEELDERPGQRS